MYILVEGMPGTGKTSVAKMLAATLKLPYMKSVLSDTAFGDKLRILRDNGNPQLMETLYLADLALDELRVMDYIAKGGLIRDKSYADSLAHILAHDYENQDINAQEAIKAGYKAIADSTISPDFVVILTADLEDVHKRMQIKTDVSLWDISLDSSPTIYLKQQKALIDELSLQYSTKTRIFNSSANNVESICKQIVSYI